MAQDTNGEFSVSTSKRHLRELLFKHVKPLPSLLPVGSTPTCNLIEMGETLSGCVAFVLLLPCCDAHIVSLHCDQNHHRLACPPGFPVFKKSLIPTLAIGSQRFNLEGYHCPRCNTKVEDLPTPCPVCGLALVFASTAFHSPTNASTSRTTVTCLPGAFRPPRALLPSPLPGARFPIRDPL